MSGKHAGRASALGAAMRVAWVGARELVAFAAVGVIAPVALLVSVPSLFDEGRTMADAATCENGGRDCLEPRAATLEESTGDTWTFDLTHGGSTELTFARRAALPNVSGRLHVLFWNDDPVALLQADGQVVGSNSWGPLYGVNRGALLLAPLWPLAVLGLGAPLLARRRTYLRALAVVTLGAAAAGPAACAGMWLAGYAGLVAGGLLPLALGLVLAGLTMLVGREKRRPPDPRRSTEPMPARLPAQRQELLETADA